MALDGTHETGGGHAGVCIVPAALGLAYAACSGNVQPTVEGARGACGRPPVRPR